MVSRYVSGEIERPLSPLVPAKAGTQGHELQRFLLRIPARRNERRML